MLTEAPHDEHLATVQIELTRSGFSLTIAMPEDAPGPDPDSPAGKRMIVIAIAQLARILRVHDQQDQATGLYDKALGLVSTEYDDLERQHGVTPGMDA